MLEWPSQGEYSIHNVQEPTKLNLQTVKVEFKSRRRHDVG